LAFDFRGIGLHRGTQLNIVKSAADAKTKTFINYLQNSSITFYTHMLHVWNIYLQLPQKLPSFVGKYSSTMVGIYRFCFGYVHFGDN
jgi:hypothetical protein